MSRRSRLVAFGALCLLLVAAGAVLIALGPSETSPPPAETTTVDRGRPEFSELEERAEVRGERVEEQILKNGVAEEEEEPPPPPIYGQTRKVAEPVARRFFAAYSLYEIGRLDASVRRELTATADADLAAELLAEPPRLPPGGKRPPRAELGRRLQLVPGPQETSQEELTSIELVGDVTRAGEGTVLLAIAMELDGRRWRVTGLGR